MYILFIHDGDAPIYLFIFFLLLFFSCSANAQVARFCLFVCLFADYCCSVEDDEAAAEEEVVAFAEWSAYDEVDERYADDRIYCCDRAPVRSAHQGGRTRKYAQSAMKLSTWTYLIFSATVRRAAQLSTPKPANAGWARALTIATACRRRRPIPRTPSRRGASAPRATSLKKTTLTATTYAPEIPTVGATHSSATSAKRQHPRRRSITARA